MDEFESLRREIEVRLWRETVYRAINAFLNNGILDKHIDSNDNHIKWIGEYLRNKYSSDWETFYTGKTSQDKV